MLFCVKIKYLTLLFLIIILLYAGCTLNNVELTLVGNWKLDEVCMEDAKGYFNNDSHIDFGDLIINNNDTYNINIKFEKIENSLTNFNRHPFDCNLKEKTKIKVKENGYISGEIKPRNLIKLAFEGKLYFNPSNSDKWKVNYAYYDCGTRLHLIFGKYLELRFKKK